MLIWNGLQVLDIDIKNYELASKFKKILFDELSKIASENGISFNLLVLQCCKYAMKNMKSEKNILFRAKPLY